MARIAKRTSEETKQEIQDAFVELYKENRLEKVTIGSISVKAGINRGTFYRYYQDVYDLLEQMEDRYSLEISKLIPTLIHGMLHKDLLMNLSELASFYDKNKDALLLLFVKQPSAKVMHHMKDCAKSYALQELALDPASLTIKQQCLIEYICNAQLGLITWWLENGTLEELPMLAETMVDANTMGALRVLMEKC